MFQWIDLTFDYFLGCFFGAGFFLFLTFIFIEALKKFLERVI
jgi:hypothetical protein